MIPPNAVDKIEESVTHTDKHSVKEVKPTPVAKLISNSYPNAVVLCLEITVPKRRDSHTQTRPKPSLSAEALEYPQNTQSIGRL